MLEKIVPAEAADMLERPEMEGRPYLATRPNILGRHQ